MGKKKAAFLAITVLLLYGAGVLTGYMTYQPVRSLYHAVRANIEENQNQTKEFKEQQSLYANAMARGKKTATTIKNGTVIKSKTKPPTDSDDIRQIISVNNTQYYISYPEGYMLSLPQDSSFDFSLSNLFTKITTKDKKMEITVSMEYSPYDDLDGYFDFYLNRFVLNDQFRKENRITLLQNENTSFAGYDTNLISARMEDYDGLSVYTYALMKTGGRTFYRLMFKYQDFEGQKEEVNKILNSFVLGKALGAPITAKESFVPVQPQHWDEKTQELYRQLRQEDSKVKWGFYTGKMDTIGIDEKVPQIEKAIDYKFDALMTYFDVGMEPPVAFMKKAADQGKMVELTMHVTANSNTDLFAYTPMLDIYRGEMDGVIRDTAKKLKNVGMPFILRLNNEMNSDWTNYAGVVNLSDPAIYQEVWKRIYRIFQEEQVNNAIWVFNPNDRNYPPCKWNNYIAYFPGADYVQMIGATGYNTGTYFSKELGEEWREFADVYDHVESEYSGYFSAYPWMITEFATSSVGGDKPKWILDMFANLNKYKNIKIAVWYSYPDMDYRPEYKGKVARPYSLDETPESLEAFRQGLKAYLSQ